MTWILGWKSKSSVFLVADTAGSRESIPPRAGQSSVGEEQTPERRDTGYFVEESLLKVGHIARDVIVGYSGITAHAMQLLKEFDARLRIDDDVTSCFKSAIGTFGKQSPLRDVQIVFGFSHGPEPYLYSYNADGARRLVSHDEQVQIGSVGSTFYPYLTDLLLSHVRDMDIPDRRVLAVALPICQSYGLFHALMDHGVGGVFCGVQVDASGVQWQSDTVTVTYAISPDGSPHAGTWIKAGFRGDVLLVKSTVRGALGFASVLMVEDPEVWQDAWRTETKAFLESWVADVYVFLRRDHRTVVVVETNGRSAPDLFEIAGGADDVALTMGPKLLEKLQRVQISQDPRELTMFIDFVTLEEASEELGGVAVETTRRGEAPRWREIVASLPALWICRSGPGYYRSFRGGQLLHSVDLELDLTSGFGWHGAVRFPRDHRRGIEHIFDAGTAADSGPRTSLAILPDGTLAFLVYVGDGYIFEVAEEGVLDVGGENEWLYLCAELAVSNDRVRLSLWRNGQMLGRSAYPAVDEMNALVMESILGASLEKAHFAHFDAHTVVVVRRPVSRTERWALTKLLESGMSGRAE